MREKSSIKQYNSQSPKTILGGNTNTMKKTLSLLVAVALVVSLFASVGTASAATTAGKLLSSADYNKIIEGTNGSLLTDKVWQKEDLAVLLASIAGEKEAAAAHAKTHTFTDVQEDYYDGYISWAQEKGYLYGYSAKKFGFNQPVNYRTFYAVVLRVLGYDTKGAKYFDTDELAVDVLGAEDTTNFDAAAIRGITYDVILTALDTKVNGSTKSLGLTLGVKKYVDAEAADKEAALEAAKPQVVTVTAINAKQVQVKFNVDVNATSAQTVSAFKINGVSPLQSVYTADTKTALLTFANASEVEVTKGTVTVAALPTAADSTVSTLAYAAYITYEDTVKPTIASVASVYATSTQSTITVTYSEPLTVTPSVIRVNNVLVSGATYPSNTQVVFTANNVAVGSAITLYIAGAQDNGGNLQDLYTGSVVAAANDTTKPAIASITQSAGSKLSVVFTEALATTNSTFTASDVKLLDGTTLLATTAATVAIDAADTTNKTYIITVDIATLGTFASANTKSYTLLIDALTGFQDAAGNQNDAYVGTVTLAKDVTAPAFVSAAKSTTGDEIELTFGEDITASTTAAGVIITNGDGVRLNGTLDLSRNSVSNKIADLDFDTTTTAAIAAGTYTIQVPAGAVQDAYGNASAAFTATVTIAGATASSDTAAPTLSVSRVSANKFNVVFTETVSQATALNLANYKLDGVALPAATQIYFTSTTKDTVQIVLPAGSVNVGTVGGTTVNAIFTVAGVADVAGNVAATYNQAVAVEDNTAATIASTTVIGTDVFVTFTENVQFSGTVATSTVFDVTVGGSAASAGNISAVAGNAKQIKFTLTATPASAPVVAVKAAQTAVTDANGYAVK